MSASRDSTCWSLIRGAAAGVPEDRAGFVARYGPVIRAYLAARWRVGVDDDEVGEAAQEVFLQCFKEGGALRRVESDRAGGFRAFLYGVTRNMAFTAEKARRRRHRESSADDALERVQSEAPELSIAFDRAWARMIVAEARQLLERRSSSVGRPAQRVEALRLRYEDGLPSREIAVRLELPVERVYQFLTDARREFRGALLEVMATYHPRANRAELERLCVEQMRAL